MLWLPFRIVGFGVLVVAPLAVFATVLLYVKLSYGAIPLQFLVGPIRNALASELSGTEVNIEDAALHKTSTGGLELRLAGVQIKSAAVAARAREAALSLDLTSLWSGQVMPERIVLIEPQIELDPPATAIPTGGGAEDRRTTSRGPMAGDSAARAVRGNGDRLNIAVVRTIAGFLGQLRRDGEAVTHVRNIGLVDGRVRLGGAAGRDWIVPEFEIALEHRDKRSIISGGGRFTVPGEPLTVSFRVEEKEKSRTLDVVLNVAGLVPSVLAERIPRMKGLEAIEAPVGVRGEMRFSSTGDLVDARFDAEIERGRVHIAALGGAPLEVESGRFALVWDEASHALQLAPSPINLVGGALKVAGKLSRIRDAGGNRGYELDVWAPEGRLVGEPGAEPVAIDRLAVKSRLWPDSHTTQLVGFAFNAGGVEITARGAMAGAEGAEKTRIEGSIGPMTAEVLKKAWPTGLAPVMRRVLVERMAEGIIDGGRFVVASGGDGGDGARRISLSLQGKDMAFDVAEGLPRLAVPRVLLRVEGESLEVDVPDAVLAGRGGKKLAIKAVRVVVPTIGRPDAMAEISGHGRGSLGAALDIVKGLPDMPLDLTRVPSGTDGKVEAQWKLSLPLARARWEDEMRVEARLKISDGRVPDVLGKRDITGASFVIGASEKAIDLKGEMLLAGVLAKAAGQWVLGEELERQPPLRIVTRLDNADRRQLGLDVDRILFGEVPIEVLLTPGRAREGGGWSGKVEVGADLTGAELRLDGIAWKKPAGRAAKLTFDVTTPKSGKGLELENFKISGDTLTINGSVSVGADNKAQAYSFPGFSLNVVTNLQVEGRRRGDVWEVKARGKTFDASQMIRSLYELDAKERHRSSSSRPVMGIDLDATIDNVLGLNETSLKQVSIRFIEREDEVAGLELRGQLEGGGQFAGVMPHRPGEPRLMRVETDNAGQALKLGGLYTSMQGGRGELVLNLDGKGAADRAGQFSVRKFRVIGDPVVYEVLQGADGGRPAIATGTRAARHVVREEVAFDELRASFSAGHGQLAIESLRATGPLVGVSLRGKADFRSRRLALGGTYVPLSGLNRALSGIPLLREIFTGPKGDGIFGITFGVTGSMSEPQVIVNPFSLVAPGVLREIFQMAPANPQVTPSLDAARRIPGGGPRVRSSPAIGPSGGVSGPGPDPQVIDGWSMKATPSGR